MPAGLYEEKTDDTGDLQLTPARGGSALIIAAAQPPQTSRIKQSEAVAVALPGEDADTHHSLLAQVHATALDASSSYSVVGTGTLTFIHITPPV